jgi:Raf kinase inhibitor-like YbhB/YbcL family protein
MALGNYQDCLHRFLVKPSLGSKRKDAKSMDFELTSSAFKPNKPIPKEHTCDGVDSSIPLQWTDPPEPTHSFAIIVDDPDAPSGTWVHWVLYDLPPDLRELPAGIVHEETLQNGAKQSRNDFGRIGYGGPCPPRGPAHRYYVKLYALDQMSGLQAEATKQQLLDAIKGHVLAEAELVGTYER